MVDNKVKKEKNPLKSSILWQLKTFDLKNSTIAKNV